MSSITLQPGNIPVVSARFQVTWRGVWKVDLELSPEVLALAPTSGKVSVVIAPSVPGPGTTTTTVVGTIDPRGSGQFVEFFRLRVLGGGGGWDQLVGREWFHSDGGLLAPSVIGATALEVGEVAAYVTPLVLADDFLRMPGPASAVLEGLDWWVDPATGTTFVGERPPVVPDPSLEVMAWDPSDQCAALACQGLVLPGTVLVDARIPASPLTVRDVEQTFDAQGSRVLAWCGVAEVTQLANDLRSMVVEFSGQRFLRTYQYRIVEQNGDGRLVLQSVDESAPDDQVVTPWTGVAGASVKYLPSSLVRLAFFRGDKGQPIVDLYEPGKLPLEATYDASAAVHLGPSAPAVDLAGGGHPVAFAEKLLAELVKIAGVLNALAGPGSYVPPAAPAAIGSVKVTSG